VEKGNGKTLPSAWQESQTPHGRSRSCIDATSNPLRLHHLKARAVRQWAKTCLITLFSSCRRDSWSTFFDTSVGSRAQSRSGTCRVASETISRIDSSEFPKLTPPFVLAPAAARRPSRNPSLRLFRFRIALLRFSSESTSVLGQIRRNKRLILFY